MKIRLLVLPSLLLLLPGCLVVRERPRAYRECRADEYWDGYECRYRGHRR